MKLKKTDQMKSRWNLAGKSKTFPADFIVEEIPLYDPCGEGEHLYVTVRKTNMSHDECVRLIAQQFKVSNRDIGCAGRKDFRAVTTQMFSVYLRGKKPEVPETIGTLEILSSSYHGNKLRLGHLTGNKFTLRIREIDANVLPKVEQRLFELSQTGMPNFFGPQRFGNYGNNHEFGFSLVKEDYDDLVLRLLNGKERHHDFVRTGEFKKAFDAWPFGQPAERNVLEALANGKTAQQACNTIGKPLRKLWVNALQSHLFNETLQSRIDDGTWNKLLLGDLAWKHDGGGRTFEITEEELKDKELHARVDSFALSPSGPLWGSKMREPLGDVYVNELKVRELHGLEEKHFESMRTYAQGARRPLRVQVENPTISLSSDEHGAFFTIEFSLPAGSYATTLIQQIL